MLPFENAKWYLGYSSLALITEQDRKHWLLKADKSKEVTDGNTGDMFLGQMINQGSYISVSTQKLPTLRPILKDFLPQDMAEIFELSASALPFSYDVNGLCCARIISTEYEYNGTNKNYKIRFDNCETIRIPFLNKTDSNVYSFQFIKTTTVPKLLMLDDNNEYTIEVDVSLSIDNGVYYYPLDTFQPIDVEDIGNGRFETILINNNNFIGYVAFWFTCADTSLGPQFSIDDTYRKFDYCGNDSLDIYNVNVYLMDGLDNDNNCIRVYPESGMIFTASDIDYSIPIDLTRVKYVHPISGEPVSVFDITITSTGNNKLYMSKNDTWVYNSNGYYECLVRQFNTNYSTTDIPLKPIFKLQLDSSIPFEKSTNNIGFAGIDINSNIQSSQYPFNLNNWTGLPEWINDEQTSSQRVIVYAIHETPNSSEENPESRQTAALILDPGLPSDSDEFDDSNIGRVYVLSNDDDTYVNNATAQYPKPERTLARTCDIPTSVAQLSNIVGIAPTSIVDPKYVRTEASYSEKEKERLFNTLSSRWVRPIHYSIYGHTIMDTYPTDETNPHVFSSEAHLKLVDLYNHNDFREHLNLNEYVKSDEVSLYSITNNGTGYQLQDVGNIIIGGFAFNYVVTGIDDNCSVTELSISPSSDNWKINLSNFDMMQGDTGITQVYGTSPVSGSGRGLRVQLKIDNYSEKIPTLGDVYSDLFALCRNSNGLWLYTYDVENKLWKQSICITEYEKTGDGIVSTKDSYINSILPNINITPISLLKRDAPETSLVTISTSSFINIVDKTKRPFTIKGIIDDNVVDINRMYCSNIYTLNAKIKNFNNKYGVLDTIQANHYDRFDSYIIWRWNDENDPTRTDFEFGIVHRSLNNLQSMDWKTTTLPSSDLNCKNYVHTNASTTVTWDISDYGTTMVWTFNPTANVHEKYHIDPSTRELRVSRDRLTWDKVDIFTNNFTTEVKLVDNNGNLLWNIASNVMDPDDNRYDRTPIYQQPNYEMILTKGTNISNISEKYQPRGNWQLVFPRIKSLRFVNVDTNYTYDAKNVHKLNVIKDNDTILDRTDVFDINGTPEKVNDKTLIINTSENDTASLKVYNSNTGKWNSI